MDEKPFDDPRPVLNRISAADNPATAMRRSGYRLSTSVGGSVTGEGGDRLVCDDPHKVDEVHSDAVRTAAIDRWDIAMSTRVNDPKTSAMVVIVQRCQQRDLSGHLLEKSGWEHLCLPAEYEGPTRVTSTGFCDPREQIGELLWTEQFGPEEIESPKRSMGSYAAAGQLRSNRARNSEIIASPP